MNLAIDPQSIMLQRELDTDKASIKKDPQALRSLCNDFEALFIQSMFKEMRKAIPRSGFMQNKLSNELFHQMLDMQVAREMAHGKGLGISEMLYEELSGQEK